MAEWPIYTVHQLVESGVIERPMDGNHGSIHPKSTDFVESGIPFIMASDLKGGRVDLVNCAFISEEQASQLAKGFSRPGDVLLSHKATLGRTAIVQDNDFPFIMLTPQVTYYRIKDPKKLNNRYLKYYFDSRPFLDLFEAWAGGGSTRAYLGITAQRELPIPVPPIEVQISIAELIAPLDDKIELNRRMNETLEEIARAIFKDWFVDFGPTRAKMVGHPAYLAPDIWSLFPERLDDDGKPEGWHSGSLSDAANLNPESWSRANYPDMLDYVDLSNTKWGTIEKITAVGRADAPSRAQRVLRPGDTIVGTVRPGNGSYAFISEDGLTGSTGFAVLRPRKPILREVVYLAATAKENIERLAHLADGGAYPAVRPELVAATELVVAPESVFSAFSAATSHLMGRVEANKSESHTLAATRDLLLPKLLSGEVAVKDAEKMVRQGT